MGALPKAASGRADVQAVCSDSGPCSGSFLGKHLVSLTGKEASWWEPQLVLARPSALLCQVLV